MLFRQNVYCVERWSFLYFGYIGNANISIFLRVFRTQLPPTHHKFWRIQALSPPFHKATFVYTAYFITSKLSTGRVKFCIIAYYWYALLDTTLWWSNIFDQLFIENIVYNVFKNLLKFWIWASLSWWGWGYIWASPKLILFLLKCMYYFKYILCKDCIVVFCEVNGACYNVAYYL